MTKPQKILSIILTVLTLVSVFSCAMPVWAAELAEHTANKAYREALLTETVDNADEKAEIVSEVAEKRDEYSKTYKRADGSFTKIFSKTPLHTYENGNWKEINNQLKINGDVIENTDGKFSIEFPETISENEKISVTNGEESIAFSVDGIGESNGVTYNDSESADIVAEDIAKTVSGITYEDVSQNTDIEYIVTPEYIKENIIVENKESLKNSYSFTIEKGKLSAVLDSENNLLFNNEKGETVFKIPAPVMKDSGGAISYDIGVSVENMQGDVLTLTYTPSQEWLGAGSRAYPVIIDPVIELPDLDDTIIEDTVIVNDTADPTSKNTNYSNSAEGVICGTATKTSHILVKLNMDVFSAFEDDNIAVTEVDFCTTGYVTGGNIIAKPVNGSWSSQTVTYADVFPEDAEATVTYGDEIADYFTGTAPESNSTASEICLNITDMFNEWLCGTRANNGFAVIPESSEVTGGMVLGGDRVVGDTTHTMQTYCTVDYVDTSCMNDGYEYVSQEIGRAGTANVNVFTRSLSLSRADLSMNGLRMPVGVNFNYNSAVENFLELYADIIGATGENAEFSVPYGNNWMPSYLYAVFSVTGEQYQVFTGEGTVAVFNPTSETTDGVTTTTFEEDESGDSGYSLELVDQESGYDYDNLKLITPNGETVYFNESGFGCEIHEAEANTDGTYDKISIALDSDNLLKIDYVTDGVGRKYDFIYSSETGLLTEINCVTAEGAQIKAGTTDTPLKVTYAYNNGNLTGVTYPDGKSVAYTYDSNGNLVTARNIDNYSINYTYDTLGKVTGVSEQVDTTSGNNIHLYELSNRQVKVIDGYSGTQTYQFGKDGKLNYTFDENGNYCKSDYAPSTDENVYSSYDWRIQAQNLLKNGSFEDVTDGKADNWTNSFTVENVESDYLCRLTSTDATTALQSQTVAVNGGKSYTFSLDAKSYLTETSADDKLYIRITAEDENGENCPSNARNLTLTNEFEQYSISVNTEFEIARVTVEVGFNNKKGDFAVNNAQLEKGKGTAEYNFIENGNFSNGTDKWSTATIVDESINGETVKAVKLTGGLPQYTVGDGLDRTAEYVLNNHISSVTQNVKINGKKGDVFSIGGWFKGKFDDNVINSALGTSEQLTNSTAQIKVTYTYTETVTETAEDGTETTTEQTLTESFAVDFAPHNEGWQFAIDSFALKGDVQSVDVTVIAKNILTDSYATGIEFSSDSSAFSFFEDETTSAESGTDTSTDETESTEITECQCETCEELDCSCRCESADACTCVQCKRQSSVESTSEDGKTITTSSFDGTQYMQSSVEYSDDMNYIVSETDTNNVSSGYSYTVNGGVTASTDGLQNATTYQSNAMGYLTLAESSVSGLTDNALKMAISYAYDGDLLTSVTQGNVQYSYAYDEWGQLKSISVDGNTLVCYNYGEDTYRTRILSIVFGSSQETGFTVKYTYDDNDNITAVEKYRYVDGEKDSIIYNYNYDNLGVLQSVKDNGTGHFIEYTDSGAVIKSSETGSVIYEIEDVTPEVTDETEEEAEESSNEPVSITQETANGVSYNHSVYESNYDTDTGKTTESEFVAVVTGTDENQNPIYGKTIGTQTLTDWFGRNEAVTVMTKNPQDSSITEYAAITSQYGYVTNDNVTTNLVATLNNTVSGANGTSTVNYGYTYDANGRITQITAASAVSGMSGTSTYTYDEAGQLVREISGNTTEYAYDSKGNISSRKVYSGETLVSTDTFTYGADAWEDRLTGYNNQTITYDSIGNPTSYMGANLSWRGRELVGYAKGNKQISYSYDVDGMRYKKTVTENDSVTATYDYVYSDGTLILLTYTANGVANTARFIYDSWGEPRGFMLNDTAVYLYIKNAQGDITGIVDESGNVLLAYSYTAWGNVTYSATNMENLALAVTLSNVNPFTYRGYCYDYDIGMYYLQSRYYDPTICRFINADSTDYLGATGTLLSYNLFAYCENDGVNFVDESGTTLAEYLYKNYKGYGYVKKQNKNSVLMKSSNSEILISVINNSILISAYMYIYGDLSTIKFATKSTYKNEFVKGIEKIWSGTFSKVFGEKVTLKTKIYLCKSYAVKVNMLNKYGTSQRTSNMSNWKLSNLGSLKIYKGGTNKKNYSLSLFYKVAAHEFAHLLGGLEVYGDKYSVLANNQKYFRLVARDIERVLKAFAMSKYQGW